MKESHPRFASRTGWNRALNRLSRLSDQKRRAGEAFLDLTESNPTRCAFDYPDKPVPAAARYEPQPGGLWKARRAVSEYYAGWKAPLDPGQILLVASTSEAYSYLFRLLCEPGDKVLAPVPSYPLLEPLARLNDIELAHYELGYYQGWEIEESSLESAVNSRCRALILVNPNNPTGSLVKLQERTWLVEFCRRHELALVADEVFLDYCFPWAAGGAASLAGETDVLTFTLNGLSKIAALPQLKLGWITVSGPAEPVGEALGRLEVISDTYLSAATAVQEALPELLSDRHWMQRQIRTRCAENLARLEELLAQQSLASRLQVEAGWSVVLRLPSIQTDEEWALDLLEHDAVLAQPGHLFDFRGEGYLVLSLIVPPAIFQEGIDRILTRVEGRGRL